MKKIIIKTFYVLLGTAFLGLGIACQNLSTLGQDPLSAMAFSFVYYLNISWLNYSVCYASINLVFFIIMMIFMKNKVNFGSILNFVLTGVFCDLFLMIFSMLNIEITNIVLKILIGILGVLLSAFGVALYAGINFGIAPYDAMPIILSNKCKIFKFKYAKMLIDFTFVLISIIIGIIILHRNDIINVNTIFSLILMGPSISFFSKLLSNSLYKNEERVFD